MRVLWFVNTLAGATEFLTGKVGVGGGWISSLEKQFDNVPEIEFAVAFPYKTKEMQVLDIEDKRYYACPRYPQTRAGRYVQRMTGNLNTQHELDGYLKAVEDFKPDLVHFFGTETGYGLIIPKLKVPSIVWIQGDMLVYSHKWFSGITRLQARRSATIKQWLNGKTWLHKFALAKQKGDRGKQIFAAGKHFIGRTDWDRRLTLLLAPQATYHHCEEILREPFYHHEWSPQTEREKLIFLTTIRGNLYKGLETVIKTASLLKKSLGRPFEWRIAGLKDSEDIVRVTRKLLKQKSNVPEIIFLGNQTPEQLVHQLKEANIYIHPSRIDNSPNSVCEAMIMGVPIISTYVGGIPSLMEENKEGVFIQDGDPYAMAGAVIDMIQQPQVAIEMGLKARERALLRHDPQTIVKNLLRIYDNMIITQTPTIRESI